jgi:hypothetical protein
MFSCCRETPTPLFFNATSGELASPDYPANYGINLFQLYSINVESTLRISLTFDVLSTEATYDYLEIFDGASMAANSLRKLVISIIDTLSDNRVVLQIIRHFREPAANGEQHWASHVSSLCHQSHQQRAGIPCDLHGNVMKNVVMDMRIFIYLKHSFNCFNCFASSNEYASVPVKLPSASSNENIHHGSVYSFAISSLVASFSGGFPSMPSLPRITAIRQLSKLRRALESHDLFGLRFLLDAGNG